LDKFPAKNLFWIYTSFPEALPQAEVNSGLQPEMTLIPRNFSEEEPHEFISNSCRAILSRGKANTRLQHEIKKTLLP